MSNIKIDELRPAGSEFFADAEGYMSELTEDELTISGGGFNDGIGNGLGGLVGVGIGKLNATIGNDVTNNVCVNALNNINVTGGGVYQSN